MKTAPVQNYSTLHYTHPSCKGGMPCKRWMIVAYQPGTVEHDENAVLDSHPERRIDAVFPLHIEATDIAIAITPLLCGEGWEMATVFNPAEPLGFDHDAF